MDDLKDRIGCAIAPLLDGMCFDTPDCGPDPDDYVLGPIADAALAEIAKTYRLVRLGDGPHGTYSRYTNGRCRCDLCREANRERGRRYRRELKERNEGFER